MDARRLLAGLVLFAGAPSRAVIDTTLDILENGDFEASLDSTDLDCVDTGPATTQCLLANVRVENLLIVSFEIDSVPGPEVDTSFSVQNASGDPQRFTLRITRAASVAGATLTGGSAAFDFADNVGDGATLAAPEGGALYTALIDGSPYRMLFAGPAAGTAPPFGSDTLGPDSFGTPLPNQAGPAGPPQHRNPVRPRADGTRQRGVVRHKVRRTASGAEPGRAPGYRAPRARRDGGAAPP